ncbi:SOS response-associated peptidase [Dawidia soli]|uniref:Abasic site processing protein n=1 Tax=Dawidia soli TaxID=2782352 RepID=A0AAP2DCI6_9BACT|nr:SOS response-associated peptidase [Dawidia soli]MBT1688877.1 SOS response-associated peptidase family protein [Dawidia soli]
MCFFKSLTASYDDLAFYYGNRNLDHLVKEFEASFQSIQNHVQPIREKLSVLMDRDPQLAQLSLMQPNQLYNQLLSYSKKAGRPAVYTQQDVTLMKRYLRDIERFQPSGISAYYENGFDLFATPVLTAGDPENYKMFHWGLVPTEVPDKNAWLDEKERLNAKSEWVPMSDDFRHTFEKGQRYLIPVSGFYEWRTLDEEVGDEDAKIKIPYYVTFRDQKPRMMAGLYSRWRNPLTNEFYYSYVLLTTKANAILEYVHNTKKRMPVFIPQEQWSKWLDKTLSPRESLQMCQPYLDPDMRAYTITKLLSSNDAHRNVPHVRYPMNYNPAIEQAIYFLQAGNHKQALEVFREAVARSTANANQIDIQHLELAARQPIIAELSLAA